MPRVSIKDEFTNLPVSRQRKWKLRMSRDRRCLFCGEPAAPDRPHCLKHTVIIRERQRARQNCKTRYLHSASYLLEAALAPKKKAGKPARRR